MGKWLWERVFFHGTKIEAWPDGKLFLVYLTLYSLERFFLAFTSSYRIIAFGLTQSQIVAVIGLAVGLVLLTWMSRRLSTDLQKVG